MFFTRKKKRYVARIMEGLRRGNGQVPRSADGKWLTEEEIAADPRLRFDPFKNHEGKIPLGVIGAQIQQDGAQLYASRGQWVGFGDDRPVSILMQSRGGKSRAFLENLLATLPVDQSVLTIDCKMALAESVARLLAARGKDVGLIAPFGVADPRLKAYLRPFNPLAMKLGDDEDSLVDLAMLIADALVVASDKDVHWDHAARELIETLVLHVLTWSAYEGRRNLNTVYFLLMTGMGTGDDGPGELERELDQNQALGGIVAAGATAHFERAENERASVVSTARRHLSFLRYPAIRRVLEGGPNNADPMNLHSAPTAYFCGVPASKMASCRGFQRLAVNLALASFEANPERSKHQRQEGRRVVLLVDETYALGRLERLEVAAGQLAGLGCKLITAWQDLKQTRIYGNAAETFLSGTIIAGANTDVTTLDWLSRRLGTTTVVNPSHSSPSYNAAVNGGATGDSFAVGTHPLLTPREIEIIFARDDPQQRLLVLLPGRPPLIVHRAFFDKHEDMRRLRHAHGC